MKGTLDQFKDISESCIILIKLWLKNQFENDVGKFLELFDFENNQEVLEKSIPLIIEGQKDFSNPEYFKQKLEDMKPNVAFYWRVLVQSLHSKDDNLLEIILPPLINFSQILEFYSKLDFFVFKQLLLMVPFFDFSDEQGRKIILEVLIKLLKLNTITEENRRLILRAINISSLDENEFLKITIQAISSFNLTIGKKKKNKTKKILKRIKIN